MNLYIYYLHHMKVKLKKILKSEIFKVKYIFLWAKNEIKKIQKS